MAAFWNIFVLLIVAFAGVSVGQEEGELDSDILFCLMANVDWTVMEDTTPPPEDSMVNPFEVYMPALQQICSAQNAIMPCIKAAASTSVKPADTFIVELMIPVNIQTIVRYACSKLSVFETHSMCGMMSVMLKIMDNTTCLHEVGPQLEAMMAYLNSTQTEGGFDVPFFCSQMVNEIESSPLPPDFRLHMNPLPGCLTGVVSACDGSFVDAVRTLVGTSVRACGNTEAVTAGAPLVTSQITFVAFSVLTLLFAWIL